MFITNRIRRWRRAAAMLGMAVAVPAALVLAGPAPAASASGSTVIPCGTQSTAQAFRQWGDQHSYYLLQSGSFEQGTSGWDLYGQAGLGNGSSPWGVWGGGQRSLRIGPYGTAVAPTFCATINEPYLRFFYLAPSDSSARLKVTLTVWRGTSTTAQTYWLAGGSGRWQVSDALRIPDVSGNGWRSVTVKFEAAQSSAAQWLIDDFSVDPWKSL